MTVLECERRRRGWSQSELGFYARVTQGEVSRFERRRAVPSVAYLERLARALGRPPDGLLDEAEAAVERVAETDGVRGPA